MKITAANLRITEVVLYTLFWILVPALSYAEEEQSLAQTLSYLKEKATGSWISWDGGVFVSDAEYIDFRTDGLLAIRRCAYWLRLAGSRNRGDARKVAEAARQGEWLTKIADGGCRLESQKYASVS